jgi:hypothetical protein
MEAALAVRAELEEPLVRRAFDAAQDGAVLIAVVVKGRFATVGVQLPHSGVAGLALLQPLVSKPRERASHVAPTDMPDQIQHAAARLALVIVELPRIEVDGHRAMTTET